MPSNKEEVLAKIVSHSGAGIQEKLVALEQIKDPEILENVAKTFGYSWQVEVVQMLIESIDDPLRLLSIAQNPNALFDMRIQAYEKIGDFNNSAYLRIVLKDDLKALKALDDDKTLERLVHDTNCSAEFRAIAATQIQNVQIKQDLAVEDYFYFKVLAKDTLFPLAKESNNLDLLKQLLTRPGNGFAIATNSWLLQEWEREGTTWQSICSQVTVDNLINLETTGSSALFSESQIRYYKDAEDIYAYQRVPALLESIYHANPGLRAHISSKHGKIVHEGNDSYTKWARDGSEDYTATPDLRLQIEHISEDTVAISLFETQRT